MSISDYNYMYSIDKYLNSICMLNTFNAEGSLRFLRSILKKIENKCLRLVAFEKWLKRRSNC